MGKLEDALGAGLAGVRVHADAQADTLAQNADQASRPWVMPSTMTLTITLMTDTNV